MKKISRYKLFLLILLLALLLIIPISNTILTKRQTTNTKAADASEKIKISLTANTTSAEINQPITIDLRTTIDNPIHTESIVAYAVGIKIPKPFIVNLPTIFHAPFTFKNSEVVDKGDYYEVQLIAANKQNEPIILQNNSMLASFTITSSRPVSTSLEFTKGLSYPSIIDSQGIEKLDHTDLPSISVFIGNPTPANTSTPTTPPINTPQPTDSPTPTIANTSAPTPTAGLCPNFSQGNANCDSEGKITLGDFICWRYEFINQQVANGCRKADFDEDGKVTLLDFMIWRTTFIN